MDGSDQVSDVRQKDQSWKRDLSGSYCSNKTQQFGPKGSNGDSEKQLDPEYILKVKPMRFTAGLNVGMREREREQKIKNDSGFFA